MVPTGAVFYIDRAGVLLISGVLDPPLHRPELLSAAQARVGASQLDHILAKSIRVCRMSQ